MVDHVSIPVADIDRAARFYDVVLATPGPGLHVSCAAPDHASVDAFHRAALACGGTDAGAPGLRPQYTMPFYGAFAIDLDGFKIEAVCRTAQQG